MSSIYTIQVTSKRSPNTKLIYVQKVTRLFVSLKGRTQYLQALYQVLKVVRSLESKCIQIQLKVYQISSFIKTFALLSQDIISSIKGRGYQSFLVNEFKSQQSIQNLYPPLGFLANSIGEEKDAWLRTIKPLYRYSRIYYRISSSFSRGSLYKGEVQLGSRLMSLIQQLQLRRRANSSTTAFEKTALWLQQAFGSFAFTSQQSSSKSSAKGSSPFSCLSFSLSQVLISLSST